MSEKAVLTLWQRRHLDDVPNHGIVVTDAGREIRYVPELTCDGCANEHEKKYWPEVCEGCCRAGHDYYEPNNGGE